MRAVGINLGHDAGVAIFDLSGRLEFFAQAERYGTRTKFFGNSLRTVLNAFPGLRLKKYDLVTTVWPEKNGAPIADYDPLLVSRSRVSSVGIPGIEHISDCFGISHHLAHAISSWCFRPDDRDRLFMAYDGCGPNAAGQLQTSLTGILGTSGFSSYSDAVAVPTSSTVANLLGPSDSAGKTMGAAGYFTDEPAMRWTDSAVLRLFNSMITEGRPNLPRVGKDEQSLRFAAGLYKFLMGHIWNALESNYQRFGGGRGLVIGGGTALALEINTKLYGLCGEVVFGPPANDSGLALGAAAFGHFHQTGYWPRLDTPALNHLERPLPAVGPQEPSEVAHLLADEQVVGLLRGRSEAGPRALGFRSILASAGNLANLKRVSQDIKGREFYRPLAPMVTAEQFDRYFVGPPGEFMQYRCECTAEAGKCLPAIVHRDNSSRPQVVWQEKDPWLHELLVEYGRLSGHECLINTSLNKAGKPIAHNYEDAVADMDGKGVVFVCLPHKSDQTDELTLKFI